MIPLCIVAAVVFGIPLVCASVAFWVAVWALFFGGPTIAAEDLGQEP